MSALNCCKTMEAELTAWKANVYDIVHKMDELPGGEKEKILSNIEDLHILIAEMDDRIDQIRKTAPRRPELTISEPIGKNLIKPWDVSALLRRKPCED